MKKIEVIYEDNHLIAINKKGGDLSQRDNEGEDSLIEHTKSYIKKKYDKPGNVFLGTIHRLDRPTSGAIIYARTSKALGRMNELFKSKNVDKVYLALVDNRPPQIEGELIHYLAKNTKKNKSFVSKQGIDGSKKAHLKYELLGEYGDAFLMRLTLYTGRHHQIRVQLRTIGCTIIGDLKYGYEVPNKDKSICLHCREMSFVHPVSKESILIKADIPSIPEWKSRVTKDELNKIC